MLLFVSPGVRAGVDLAFSPGGRIFKKFSEFYRPFFTLNKLSFRAVTIYYKDPILTKFFAPQAKF